MTIKERKKILDKELKTLLKNTVVSWDNVKKIEDIGKALKSQNEWTKRRVIDIYNK